MDSIARKMARMLLTAALALLVLSPASQAELKKRSASSSAKPLAIPTHPFQRFSAVSQPRVPIGSAADAIKTPDLALPPAAMAHADAPKGKPGQGPEEAKGGPLGDLPKQVEGQIDASADPKGSDESAVGAIDNAAKLLAGGKAGAAGGEVGVSPALGGAVPASLAKADDVKPAASAEVPAAAAKQPKTPKPINSPIAYKVTRFVLAAIATHWGVVYSMPPASPELTQKILQREARNVEVVYSDNDDTLTNWNAKLSPEMAAGVDDVLAAGKTFMVVTDRVDYEKPGTKFLGALEILSPLLSLKREGIMVATNIGGKIYESTATGEWKLLYEEPPISDDHKLLIAAAAAAVKKDLASRGIRTGTEIFNPHSYSLILTAGVSEKSVKAAGALMEAELKKQAKAARKQLDYEVVARMPKDPANAPYISILKLNKSVPVQRIIELKKLQGKKALGMGDNMYAPQKSVELMGWRARTAPWAMRLGAWLSGRPVPQTGNRTDANMELGDPGMLMLSVGGSADPRMPNGYVLSGKGPEQSLQILRAVSSAKTPAAADPERKANIMAALFIAYILGFLAVIRPLGYRLIYDGNAQAYNAISSIPDQMKIHP